MKETYAGAAQLLFRFILLSQCSIEVSYYVYLKNYTLRLSSIHISEFSDSSCQPSFNDYF